MLVPITNTPRDYAWGSHTAIAELLGTSASGGPEAELWLGTHPGSPARLADGSGSLADVVELPFLLKVLAADAPLSLQAHPTPAQAREGFAREEAAGIPIDSPERNYKDPYAKPEMIYALSDPFRALSGFRPVDETRVLLEPLADDPRISGLLARLRTDADLEPVLAWLLAGGDEVDELVEAVVEGSSVDDALSWDVVRRLSETNPGDPGIVVSLLLHAVDLRPGEALFLPAGNIHAYISGLGIELMTASDNVLRGGLTPKHIDVPELIEVLDFRAHPVPYLRPSHPSAGVERFQPDGDPFILDVVDGADAVVALGGRPALLIRIEGDGTVDGRPMPSGSAWFADGEDAVSVAGAGRVFIATGPAQARDRSIDENP